MALTKEEIDKALQEDVGEGRDPDTGRFKAGYSGNPNGRPSYKLDFDAIVAEVAQRDVSADTTQGQGSQEATEHNKGQDGGGPSQTNVVESNPEQGGSDLPKVPAKTHEVRHKPGGGFAPGFSGNPGGRPKVAQEIRKEAQTHVQSAMALIVEMMTNKGVNPAQRLQAARYVLGMAGVPTQASESKVDVTHTDNPLVNESLETLNAMYDALKKAEEDAQKAAEGQSADANADALKNIH